MNLQELGFDFKQMAQLAKEDPVAFAHFRDDMIRRLIEASPHRQRLARLQMVVDAARYSSSPEGQPVNKVVALLLDRTAQMTEHVATLNDILEVAAERHRAQ